MKFIQSTPSTHPMDAVVGIYDRFVIHTSEYDGHDNGIEKAIFETAEYATNLLAKNLRDNSKYFLFTLDQVNSNLTISVVSDDFESESEHVTRLIFENIQKKLEESENPFEESCRYNEIIKSTIVKFADSTNKDDIRDLKIAFLMSDDGLDDIEVLST